jgi:hypothetical protein
MIAFDTQTRAAIIVGTPDPAAAAELGLPSHEDRADRGRLSTDPQLPPSNSDRLVTDPDYIRALLSGRYTGRELDAMVAARLTRQQILDTDREFHFLLTEGALRWHVGSPQVMAEQVEHLIELGELPNVRLGLVPWTRAVNRPILHPFQIYDSRAVLLQTETSTALLTDTRDVADFTIRFDLYAAFAEYDDSARGELRRIATEYRTLG